MSSSTSRDKRPYLDSDSKKGNKREALLSKYGLSEDTALRVYEFVRTDHNRCLSLFGVRNDFTKSTAGKTYQGFGVYGRPNLFSLATKGIRQNPELLWNKLDEDLQNIISVEEIGTYLDHIGREYIPVSSKPGSVDYSTLQMRLPAMIYENREAKEYGIPKIGDEYVVYGRLMYVLIKVKSVEDLKEATMLVTVSRLQEEDRLLASELRQTFEENVASHEPFVEQLKRLVVVKRKDRRGH